MERGGYRFDFQSRKKGEGKRKRGKLEMLGHGSWLMYGMGMGMGEGGWEAVVEGRWRWVNEDVVWCQVLPCCCY